jgi:hypothetical protein
MTDTQLNLDDIAALTALANGIIPPDETDGGAAKKGRMDWTCLRR